MNKEFQFSPWKGFRQAMWFVIHFTSISRRSTMSFFVAAEVMEVMGRSTYFQAGFFAFLASGGLAAPLYINKK